MFRLIRSSKLFNKKMLTSLKPAGTQHFAASSSTSDKLSEDSKRVKQSFLNLIAVKDAPVSALFYGFSGLIPFVYIPAHMIQMGNYIPELAYAHLAYGAVILSFLGGSKWGTTIPNPGVNELKPNMKNLGWAILPSLIGWTSLLVSPASGNLLVASGLSLCLVHDLSISTYPVWYKSMRTILSIVAIVSLLISLGCRYLPPEKDQ